MHMYVYICRKSSTRTDLSSEYYCIRGYQASLRCSLAGLTLNIDMSVSAFLKGGRIIDLMWQVHELLTFFLIWKRSCF